MQSHLRKVIIKGARRTCKEYTKQTGITLRYRDKNLILCAANCIQHFDGRKIRDDNKRLIEILLNDVQLKQATVCIDKFKEVTPYTEDLLNDILTRDAKELEKLYVYITEAIKRNLELKIMQEQKNNISVSQDDEAPNNSFFNMLIAQGKDQSQKKGDIEK